MASEVKLPRLGQGMEAGTIVRWLKSEGDKVQKGEPLYELDTDKVTQEVEAEASGVLLKIAVQEGEVEVGRTIAFIGEAGEDVSVPSQNGGSAAEAGSTGVEEGSRGPARDDERERGRQAAAKAEPPAEAEAEAEPERGDGRVKASPLARRIARERGIELSSLQGTGPEGRIVAEDVERAAVQPGAAVAAAPAGEIEVVKLDSMRKTIARRLTEAWQAPVFQLTVSADMTRVNELRKALVERTKEGEPKPSVTDLLTKLSALALMRHRAVNARFAGDSIELYPTANVGIAVAIPKGLVVPVLHGAERLSVPELAAARTDVVQRARAGKLQKADFDEGTFTISNLGMYGIEQFVAVLNPPQASILAVGATEDRPVARGGEVVVRPMMTMTLTSDHRALDGATAADFLRTLKEFLEEPALAL